MSDGFALAAITAVLRARINARLVANDVGSVVGGFAVTSLPPQRITGVGNADPTQLNLFLHQVTPNVTYRNADQPTRSTAGNVTTRPALVLDLHYLMTAYGAQELFAETLMGHAALLMHEEPVLSRQHIRDALQAPIPAQIATSGIDAQSELIRISPEAISSEEMSRMWSALDAQYRLSTAYKVSVAFIESDSAPGAALPVTRRLIRVLPTLGAHLTGVSAQGGDGQALTMADTVVIDGTSLATDGLSLRFGTVSHAPSAAQITPTRIVFPLADLATPPLPGLVPLNAVISPELGDPPVPHQALVSNTVALPLAATFTQVVTPDSERVVDGVIYRTGDLALTTTPVIGARQRVSLSLNQLGSATPRLYSFDAPPNNGVTPPAETTNQIVFRYTDVAAGDYLLRLRVDGVDSPLGFDGAGNFDSPQVTI